MEVRAEDDSAGVTIPLGVGVIDVRMAWVELESSESVEAA